MYGLCGAHRCGKSTLARAYAEKHGLTFLETSVSAIFKELGLNPTNSFTFKKRLDIQEVILERLDATYGEPGARERVITDRTPIDMLGYTVSEAIGTAVTSRDQKRFAAYVEKCFEVTNRRFSTLVLVQPGIPLVKAKGKGALNLAYIEHLNSLMMGLQSDQRVKVPHYYIPRSIVDLDDRVAALENAFGRSYSAAIKNAAEYVNSGGRIH